MATVTAGTTGTYTFSSTVNGVSIALDSGERAHVTVLSSAGVLLCKDNISNSRTIGPFADGAVMSLTAIGGDVDYTPLQASSIVPTPRGGAMLAADGNSITALAGAPTTSQLAPTADSGWLNWGLAFAGQSIRWVDNQAVSGHTINQRTAQLQNWVPTTIANTLVFLEGTNSIAGYVTAGNSDAVAAQLAWADMQAYLSAVRSFGKFKQIILPTCTPRGSSASRNAAHDWFNRKLRDLCSNDSFYLLVDFWRVVVDPTSTAMSARANYLRSDDNLHPTPKGCRAMGKAFATSVSGLSLPTSNLLPTSALTRAIDSSSSVINSNPTFIGGNTGSLLNGATGAVKAGWRAGIVSGTATAVASVGADDEGYGGSQILTVSGAASGTICGIIINATEALTYAAIGDFLKGIAKAKWSGASGVKAIYVRVSTVTDQSYSVDGFASTTATATVSDYDNADMTDNLVMVTPAIKFPGNVAPNTILSMGVYVLFGAASGAITLTVSRGALLNLGQQVTDY